MKYTKLTYISLLLFSLALINCKNQEPSENQDTENKNKEIKDATEAITPPEGMVLIEEKIFLRGAKSDDAYAMPREKPAHMVKVGAFFIDKTEVTNAQYKKFVDETGYITVAERPIDWDEMKKELPPNTPKPHDSILQPGSLIFNKNVEGVVGMNNYSQWWTWKIGANWKHPEGPESSIEGKDNYPVVHIAYEDALAYCKWANRRLPTEAEWESAAQGNNTDNIYTWGNEKEEIINKANTWQGQFPVKNIPSDGFSYLAPVKSYEPNSAGIYDMLGNVWEWTSDIYNENYYKTIYSEDVLDNPKGATSYYNPQNPYQVEMVMKGGSYLCHDSYCASYRISARMSTSKDSGTDHLGFRTVATETMLNR